MQPAELESIALMAAAEASSCALAHALRLPSVERKPDRTLVSAADREVERVIKEFLHRHTRDTAIYGEETGFSFATDSFDKAREPYWIIDPIDGTSHFLARIPTWAIMIAYVEKGAPVVGVIALPALGEIFSASRGNGATYGPLNEAIAGGKKPETPCQTSGQNTLREAYISYSSPAQFAYRGLNDLFFHLAFSCREFRTESDAFGYTRLLKGGIDVMIDLIAAPYDLPAVQVLCEEAPGVAISSFSFQQAPDLFARGGAIAASSPDLLQALRNFFLEKLETSEIPVSQFSTPVHEPTEQSEEVSEPLSLQTFAQEFQRLAYADLLKSQQESPTYLALSWTARRKSIFLPQSAEEAVVLCCESQSSEDDLQLHRVWSETHCEYARSSEGTLGSLKELIHSPSHSTDQAPSGHHEFARFQRPEGSRWSRTELDTLETALLQELQQQMDISRELTRVMRMDWIRERRYEVDTRGRDILSYHAQLCFLVGDTVVHHQVLEKEFAPGEERGYLAEVFAQAFSSLEASLKTK